MSIEHTEVTLENLERVLATKGYLSFEHKELKNRDGSPLRARANGRIQTWKTRPGLFKLPCKHGLRDCFYIEDSLDASNNNEWWIV